MSLTHFVTLSPDTKKLIGSFNAKESSFLPNGLSGESTHIQLGCFLSWMNTTHDDINYSRVESLRVSLWQDYLLNNLGVMNQKKTKKRSWPAIIRFIVLAVAGMLFAGCEGFDGIAALLGLFSAPLAVVIGVGLLFSVLSVMMFMAFDLHQISQQLGVGMMQAPKLLDTFLDELTQMREIRHAMNAHYSQQSKNDLEGYLMILTTMENRLKLMDDARKTFQNALDNKALKLAKWITSATIGLLFFGGGYFAGQTVALAMVSIFMASIPLTTFWPIVAASILVGIAALSVYWFLQRPGVENLIGQLCGLDQENIALFCDEEKIKDDITEIKILERNITASSSYRQIVNITPLLQVPIHYGAVFKRENTMSGANKQNFSYTY